jgi:hypothetical protein
LNLELVRLLSNVLLQNLAFSGLRETKIHHLIEELIDDHEVVADGLLLELLEVLGENLSKLATVMVRYHKTH